jgi:dihydrofolate synthase/folylpolyglutamate synthase
VVGRIALDRAAPLIEVHPLPEDWTLGVPGRHQRENAALAVEAVCRLLGDGGIASEQIQAGLAKTHWPARFQRLGEDGRLVIDGAHNSAAIAALVETWRSEFGDKKATIVFGGVSGKDTVSILEQLSAIAARFLWVTVSSKRGYPAEKLAAMWTGDLPAEPSESLSAALAAARGHSSPILITGSLFLAGAALAELGSTGEFEVSEQ